MNMTTLRQRMRGINHRPTDRQKSVGNYKKGHVRVHGLNITIENKKGSIRSGKTKSGKVWSAVLPDHYGYIKRTRGADGDHVDVYLGPDFNSNKVFVVDQKHHQPDDKKHGKFDEHKCMIGYPNLKSATDAYRAAFSDNHDRVLAITIMTLARFKKWLAEGDTKFPVNYFSKIKPS